MRIRHFRLATDDAPKQCDGISLLPEPTLHFAQQHQQSVVIRGKLLGSLQRNFSFRKSALDRELLSRVHQLVYLRAGRPAVSWS